MKKNIRIRTIFLLLIFCFSYCDAQSKLKGKTFRAIVGLTSKEFNDGGCMIYTYCSLTFEIDSVKVNYKVVPYCSPKERDSFYTKNNSIVKKYKWKFYKNTITIKNFNVYGKLILKGKKIIGKKEFEEE